MIRITKPADPPEVLRTRGPRKRAAHCRDYTLHPAEYDSGTRTFSFDGTIYGHATVKQALIAAQHGKCAFCERKIGGEGDVEHFRPKAGFCQGRGQPTERPGYYWLAYDWDNLLLACPICNQRVKKNYFPLADPSRRARSHRDDITREQPIFIHPAEEDPARLIGFRKEIAYAVNGNARAVETVEALGLNRENLAEERREHLSHLIYLRKVLDQEHKLSGTEEGRQLLSEARGFLARSRHHTAKFAAMARAAATVDYRISLP